MWATTDGVQHATREERLGGLYPEAPSGHLWPIRVESASAQRSGGADYSLPTAPPGSSQPLPRPSSVVQVPPTLHTTSSTRKAFFSLLNR